MRYAVLNKSQHGCCFYASVIDTKNPQEDDEPNVLCETWTAKEAELICAALNVAEAQNYEDVAETSKPVPPTA